MSHRIATFVSLAVLTLSPALAVAADEASSTQQIEELAIQMASTPAEHAALASYYREKAAEARAEARKHEHMRHGYSGKSGRNPMFNTHCERLVKLFESQATEYDALAAMHDDEGKATASE